MSRPNNPINKFFGDRMKGQQLQQQKPRHPTDDEAQQSIDQQFGRGEPKSASADPYGGCRHKHIGAVKEALRDRNPLPALPS